MKAQMEVMGIAIIMILITVGVLFAVKYVFSQQPSSLEADFEQEQLAQQMVTVLLRTSAAPGGRESIQSLLVRCAADGRGEACTAVQRQITGIFQSTLDVWGMKYYFFVQIGQEQPLMSIGTPCTSGKTTGEQPLQLSQGIARVILEICG
ncbi:hypothetical protein HY491_03560 [Candidatus Woesearchaeota archaeon]|nr:hypothetical protein [Candidatus Woesearchaeota archaeon]